MQDDSMLCNPVIEHHVMSKLLWQWWSILIIGVEQYGIDSLTITVLVLLLLQKFGVM